MRCYDRNVSEQLVNFNIFSARGKDIKKFHNFLKEKIRIIDKYPKWQDLQEDYEALHKLQQEKDHKIE